jgi:hypothetical protein
VQASKAMHSKKGTNRNNQTNQKRREGTRAGGFWPNEKKDRKKSSFCPKNKKTKNEVVRCL